MRDSQQTLRRVALYCGLLAAAIPFVFPFYWMISNGLKRSTEVFLYPPQLVPTSWQWQNFLQVFEYQPFLRQYWNSVYIALLVAAAVTLVGALAGYVFARLRFPGRTVAFLAILSGLMVPSEVTIIPHFLMMRAVDLTNTHIPLILIPAIGAPSVIGTFIMRQYFLTLPRELEEAGKIDGLSHFGVFLRIALPLARPAMAAVALLAFLASWNAFLEPLVFLDEESMFTVPVALTNIVTSDGLPVWHLQMAATTLSVIPVLIVFLSAQRQMVQGFLGSGITG